MTDNELAFVYETTIATTPQRLWDALTTGDITRQYWFGRRVESDWAVGSPVQFFDGDSITVSDSGTVLESDPPQRLVYSFAPAGQPLTRVAFALDPQPAGKVRLRLTHDQLTDPGEIDGWRKGWTPILANLEAFLEGREPSALPPQA